MTTETDHPDEPLTFYEILLVTRSVVSGVKCFPLEKSVTGWASWHLTTGDTGVVVSRPEAWTDTRDLVSNAPTHDVFHGVPVEQWDVNNIGPCRRGWRDVIDHIIDVLEPVDESI